MNETNGIESDSLPITPQANANETENESPHVDENGHDLLIIDHENVESGASDSDQNEDSEENEDEDKIETNEDDGENVDDEDNVDDVQNEVDEVQNDVDEVQNEEVEQNEEQNEEDEQNDEQNAEDEEENEQDEANEAKETNEESEHDEENEATGEPIPNEHDDEPVLIENDNEIADGDDVSTITAIETSNIEQYVTYDPDVEVVEREVSAVNDKRPNTGSQSIASLVSAESNTNLDEEATTTENIGENDYETIGDADTADTIENSDAGNRNASNESENIDNSNENHEQNDEEVKVT